MSRFLFPIRSRFSIGVGVLAAVGLLGGCGLAETQPDEDLASTDDAAPAGSFGILAGRSVVEPDGSFELRDGVVVNFDDDIILSAERVTVREGQPWQLYGFSLSHAAGTLTGDRGTFDPESQAEVAGD